MVGRRDRRPSASRCSPMRGGYVVADPTASSPGDRDRPPRRPSATSGTRAVPAAARGVTTVGALLRFGPRAATAATCCGSCSSACSWPLLGLLVPIMTGKVLGNFVARGATRPDRRGLAAGDRPARS